MRYDGIAMSQKQNWHHVPIVLHLPSNGFNAIFCTLTGIRTMCMFEHAHPSFLGTLLTLMLVQYYWCRPVGHVKSFVP